MAALTAEQRKHLHKSSFALPGGRYPINDISHARNALSRASQFASNSQKARIRAAVHRKFPSIGKADGGMIVPQNVGGTNAGTGPHCETCSCQSDIDRRKSDAQGGPDAVASAVADEVNSRGVRR